MNAWKSYHKGGNKYNARKVMVDGKQFDSLKEGRRFQSLRLMEKSGIIEDLRRQVTFTLIPPQDIRARTTRFDNFSGRDTDIEAETLELSRKVLGI